MSQSARESVSQSVRELVTANFRLIGKKSVKSTKVSESVKESVIVNARLNSMSQ